MRWSCWDTTIVCIIVSLSTWLTPMKGHHSGWLIVYGSQRSIEANATYHGYDLSYSPERCGVAAMSPSNLGNIVWIRPVTEPGKRAWPWVRCVVIDTVARTDWHHSVYEIPGGDLAEIPLWLAQRWGTDYGLRGEAYYGACPPDRESVPSRYLPPVVVDPIRPVIAYSAWPYPAQRKPVDCSAPPWYYMKMN